MSQMRKPLDGIQRNQLAMGIPRVCSLGVFPWMFHWTLHWVFFWIFLEYWVHESLAYIEYIESILLTHTIDTNSLLRRTRRHFREVPFIDWPIERIWLLDEHASWANKPLGQTCLFRTRWGMHLITALSPFQVVSVRLAFLQFAANERLTGGY